MFLFMHFLYYFDYNIFFIMKSIVFLRKKLSVIVRESLNKKHYESIIFTNLYTKNKNIKLEINIEQF